MPNQREHSRQNWNSGGTIDEINSGCLQRIADAIEAMAKNYNNLLAEIESLKHWRDFYRDENNEKAKTISALRGVITKLKKNNKR